MSVEPSVTFKWKIENFLFCTLEEGKSLNSPAFYVETLSRSEWYLGICPNDDEIKAFLHNVYYNDSNFFIDYNISYLNKDGSVLWTADEKDVQINTGTSYKITEYPTKSDLYAVIKKPFLLQDGLTIQCQIWQSRKVCKQSLKFDSRTWIGIERRIFHWEVPEFNQLELNGEKRTRRIIIGSNKPTFSLELYLTGDNANDSNISVDIKQLNESISRLFSSFEISILNSKGETLDRVWDYKKFLSNDTIFNFNWCLTKNEIMLMLDEFLDCDVLNLLFTITFSTDAEHSYIESVTSLPSWIQNQMAKNAGMSLKDVQDPESDVSLNDVLNPGSDENERESSAILEDNFVYLYNDRSFADFELRSESVPFPVHKHVLAARSPVFKAMFASCQKEGEDDFMDIPDLNPVTLSMLLKFIYTGDVEKMDWSSAADLYYAANKYEVQSLKQMCYNFLYGLDS